MVDVDIVLYKVGGEYMRWTDIKFNDKPLTYYKIIDRTGFAWDIPYWLASLVDVDEVYVRTDGQLEVSLNYSAATMGLILAYIRGNLMPEDYDRLEQESFDKRNIEFTGEPYYHNLDLDLEDLHKEFREDLIKHKKDKLDKFMARRGYKGNDYKKIIGLMNRRRWLDQRYGYELADKKLRKFQSDHSDFDSRDYEIVQEQFRAEADLLKDDEVL